MKINEKWEKWIPIKELNNKYDIENIFYGTISDDYWLKIILSNCNEKSKKICITFEGPAHSFRYINLKFMSNKLNSLKEKYSNTFFEDHTFFKVSESEYLDWLSKASCTISDNRKLKHFAFIGKNSVLDVIDGFDPKIESIQDWEA